MTAVFPVLPGHDIAGHYFEHPASVFPAPHIPWAGISTEPSPRLARCPLLDPAPAIPALGAGAGVEWVPSSTRRRYQS